MPDIFDQLYPDAPPQVESDVITEPQPTPPTGDIFDQVEQMDRQVVSRDAAPKYQSPPVATPTPTQAPRENKTPITPEMRDQMAQRVALQNKEWDEATPFDRVGIAIGKTAKGLGDMGKLFYAGLLPKQFGGVKGEAVSQTYGSPSPIDTETERMASEDRAKGKFPLRSIGVKIGQGLAETVPKIAVIAPVGAIGGPIGLIAESAVAGGLFGGIDEGGNFHPKDFLVGAAMPGVMKGAGKLTSAAVARAIQAGAPLESRLVQNVIETVGEQAALNAYMMATSAPELIKAHRENPDAFKEEIATIVGQNMAFALFGVNKFLGNVPTHTESFISKNAEKYANAATRMAAYRLGGPDLREAGRDINDVANNKFRRIRLAPMRERQNFGDILTELDDAVAEFNQNPTDENSQRVKNANAKVLAVKISEQNSNEQSNAGKTPSSTGVSQPEVRPPVVETPPVGQPGAPPTEFPQGNAPATAKVEVPPARQPITLAAVNSATPKNPINAVWSNKGTDSPVVIVGYYGNANGRQFVRTSDGTRIPLDEVFSKGGDSNAEEKGQQGRKTLLTPPAAVGSAAAATPPEVVAGETFLHPSGKPNGTRARVRWGIISASTSEPLVGKTVSETQTRQREGDVESNEQVLGIAANADPLLLMRSASAQEGAPVIDREVNQTVAGNGRLWGIIEGYKRQSKSSARYRDAVREEAQRIGLGKEASEIPDPILVHVADGYERGDRRSFVTEANPVNKGAREDAATGALGDLDALGDLSWYQFTESGALKQVSVERAGNALQSKNRQGDARTRSGKWDARKITARVQRAGLAQMAKSAGIDISDLIYLFESEHGQRVISEIMKASPRLQSLTGDLSIGGDLLASLRELQVGLEAKRDGAVNTLDEWYSNRKNELAGIKNELSPEAEFLLGHLVQAQTKPTLLRKGLEAYANIATEEQKYRREATGVDLTGETREAIPGSQLTRRAFGELENEAPPPSVPVKPAAPPVVAVPPVIDHPPLAPAERAAAIASMSADIARLMKLREKLGKGAKELNREALRFVNWMVDNRGIRGWADITNADLLEWASNAFEGREVDATSRNKYVNFARQILKLVSADNPSLVPLLESAAFEPMKAAARVEGSQGKFYTPEDTAKLISPETSSDPYAIRNKAFFALMRYTGYRVEDVARLKLSDVDLETGTLRNSLINKQNKILPMRAIPELAVFNIRRFIESGARALISNPKNIAYLFPGEGVKGHITTGNMLDQLQDYAARIGVKLENGSEAVTTAFRNTFAQDLAVRLRLDKVTLNELAGRVGDDVTESNYISRHSDADWIENVNRKNVSQLPDNEAFKNSQDAAKSPVFPKADPNLVGWRKRKGKSRDLAAPNPGLSGRDLKRYYALRAKEVLTPKEQREFESLSNVDQGGLFQGETAGAIKESARLRAADLRQQADENDRLANLRYEAWARGSNRAEEEYRAYSREALRLRKQADEFDQQAGGRFQAKDVSEPSPERPEQGSLFTNPEGPGAADPSEPSGERIVFTVKDGKISKGYSSEASGVHELRTTVPEDLEFIISHPDVKMPEELRAQVRGVSRSGLLENFPGLQWAITNHIDGTIPGVRTITAEHIGSERLIRFLNWSKKEDPAHELMHHLQYYLRPEDRDWIRTHRIHQIREELGKARAYPEFGQLQDLLKQQYSSDGFFAKKYSSNIYHLANEYEFFAWMMTDKAAAHFDSIGRGGFIQYIRRMTQNWFHALKKLGGLTTRDEDIWNQVINGKYEYSKDVRQRWNELNKRSLSAPVDDPAYNMGDMLDPETAWAQIESASRLAIPNLVKGKVEDYTAAATKLDTVAYDTKRFKAAKQKIDELVTAARRAAAQSGSEYWQQPQVLENLTRGNENLGDALQALGIEFDPATLSAAQMEIRFENRSRSLASMERKLEATNRTIGILIGMGWEPTEYAEFTQTGERLAKAIAKMQGMPERDNAMGQTLSERAAEIKRTVTEQPELQAKRDALELPEVYEQFVAPNEAGVIPQERLSRVLVGFTAAMNDTTLNVAYKDAMAKMTNDALNGYEDSRARFIKWSEARRKEVAASIRAQQSALSDANVDFGLQRILRDEVSRVAQGERGLTGTLSGRDALQFVNDSYGTMITFANNLRAAYPGGGAEAVLMRLLGGISGALPESLSAEMRDGTPEKFFGTVDRIMAELANTQNPELAAIKRSAGVADYALARILYVLSRAPKSADAIGAIIRYGQRKIAEEPGNQLDRIGSLLDSTDPLRVEEGRGLLAQMVARADEQQTLAAARLSTIERELKSLNNELGALDRGRELFDAVLTRNGEANPEYYEIKRKVSEWLNVRERMIVSTGGNPKLLKAVSNIFKKFSLDLPDLKIKRDEDLIVNAGREFFDKESDFQKIQEWFADAEKYVVAFRSADESNRLDPATAKTPEELGFDRAVARGLEDALKLEGRYLDPSILFFSSKLNGGMVERWMLGVSFFRQYLASAKMTHGQTARDFLSAIVNYGNTLNRSKAVYHDHRLKIQEARLKALNSHKEYVDGNLEIYRTKIFNEMASEGRQFGNVLRAGMTLPASGQRVTAEDIALLKTLQGYYTDLRRRVTETGGRGIIEQRGNQRTGNLRTLVRGAASVGEFGLPMHISSEGSQLMGDIQAAYAIGKEQWPKFTDDLTAGSPNDVVRFWNRNSSSLIRHILDSGRAFRGVQQDARMQVAEKSAALELRESNDPLAIKTVDDAVALIAKHLPTDAGIDVRQYAAKELLAELEQYSRNADGFQSEMAELTRSEGIGGLSLNSEFTTPAARFNFPSNWYDFGTITNSGLMMTTARSMHEPILEFSKSLERMKATLQQEITRVGTMNDAPVNYKSLGETIRVQRIIEGTLGDLKKSWDFNDPDVARRGLELPPDLIKASLLASPTVNIKNVILGGALAFNHMAALNRYSRLMGMLHALKNVAGAAARIPIDLAFSDNNPIGRKLNGIVRGPLRHSLGPLSEWLASRIVDAHIDDVSKVQSLGFSLREPFVKSVLAMWRETGVYQRTLSYETQRGKLDTARRFVGNVFRTGTAIYKLVGTEFFDKIINSQSVGFAGSIERTLMEAAEVYGRAHESLGEFNPSDERWLIKPEEFSKRWTSPSRAQNLAQFRSFLSGADLSLEHLMWNYYKGLKAFREGRANEPSMFDDHQYDAVRSAALRAFNAGDALNRPTAISNSRIFRMLATFQGYSSNFLVNFFGAFGAAKSQGEMQKIALAIPTLGAMAFAYASFGLLSGGITDWYKRTFQGAAQRQVTVFTKEFWNDYGKAKDATTEAVLSNVPLLGDLALFTRGVVVNNRGYEPTGRILAFGLMKAGFNAVRGMWNLYAAGDKENMLNPARDFLLQYAGFGREVAYATSPHYAGVKDYKAGQGVLSFAFEQKGFKDPRQTSQVSSDPSYGPTSGIKEDIQAAMMARNPQELMRQYQKLVAFYQSKGLENPETVAQRDVQAMNPIVRAMGGKKPTQEQYDTVYAGLTPAQRDSVNKSVSGWDWGANALGISYNPTGEKRSAGVGAGAGAGSGVDSGAVSSALRSAGRPMRRISLGGIKYRPIRRIAGSGGARIRSSRRKIRLGGRTSRSRVASAGYRRPKQRRLRLA